ncbi:MAG: SpoIIE family protein phosphatase, partial [Planctomycetota bacterium]
MSDPRVEEITMGDPVLRVQQAVSRASSEQELIYNFVRELHDVGEVHQYMELALVPGRDDAFVIADHIDIADPDLTPAGVMRNNKWPTGLDIETIHTGGLLGDLIKGHTPKLLRGVCPNNDERLKGIIRTTRDALAVPVFFDGAITQWAVLFRSPGIDITENDVRLSCAVVNMLSRGAYQLRLQQHVERLVDDDRREFEEIATLQRNLLPQTLPDPDGLEFASHYTPSSYAGGDYYDFRAFDDGSIGMVVADVAGHGPKAAVVMAMLRSAMFLERERPERADSVVRSINSFIHETVTDGIFVTAFFLRIHPDTGACQYANAGHCPPRLIRADGTIETIDQNATLPLGVLEDIDPEGGTFTLEPG